MYPGAPNVPDPGVYPEDGFCLSPPRALVWASAHIENPSKAEKAWNIRKSFSRFLVWKYLRVSFARDDYDPQKPLVFHRFLQTNRSFSEETAGPTRVARPLNTTKKPVAFRSICTVALIGSRAILNITVIDSVALLGSGFQLA
ncbi:hypothetical protein D915_006757 [Fasciola hepatica]|uniref:Uncharacterized protein n=1 Tax=Fasciola hepatica TaxID=6192 RepID=A0A4E0R3L4_FASHE|nr:hypothetical protein D915_006757 [Fasciola hepatica]